MKSLIITGLKVFALLSVLLGVIYPALITLTAQSLFNDKANGSLLRQGDKIVGSSLIAQKFQSDRYFWPRPSASDFGAVPSGASNQGPTSKALKAAMMDRQTKGMAGELLFASGSGLDPHISVDAAIGQIPRIVQARQLGDTGVARLNELIQNSVERRDLGILGEERINVLSLNLALDRR